MVHIASPRYTARRVRETTVRVYSNMDEVRLQLNGESLPVQKVSDHVATWKVSLKDGDNTIEAFAGKDLHDVVHWQYTDSVSQ
jgi:beta-galactosidase